MATHCHCQAGGQWQPTPVSLSGESDGQKNLEGYSPLGSKELDTTEAVEHTYQKACCVKEGPLYIYSESKLQLSGEDGGFEAVQRTF